MGKMHAWLHDGIADKCHSVKKTPRQSLRQKRNKDGSCCRRQGERAEETKAARQSVEPTGMKNRAHESRAMDPHCSYLVAVGSCRVPVTVPSLPTTLQPTEPRHKQKGQTRSGARASSGLQLRPRRPWWRVMKTRFLQQQKKKKRKSNSLVHSASRRRLAAPAAGAHSAEHRAVADMAARRRVHAPHRRKNGRQERVQPTTLTDSLSPLQRPRRPSDCRLGA
jgi:hypothetical protein